MRIMKFTGFCLVVLLVLVGAIPSIWSQIETNSSKNRNSIKSTKRVYRSMGWNIPERSQIPFGAPRGIEIDGVPVQIEAFKPNEELTDLEEYYSPSESEIRIILGKYRIGTLFVYSVDKKPFAVQVSYSPVLVMDSRIEASGATISILYIDDDGDGKFEVRIQTTAHPSVPNWLR